MRRWPFILLNALSSLLLLAVAGCGSDEREKHDPIQTAIEPDVAAPEFLAAYPQVAAVGVTSVTLAVSVTEDAVLYYVVLPQGTAAPSPEQVMDPLAAALAAVASGSVNIVADSAQTFVVNGLASQISYDAYLLASDAAGNSSAVAHLSYSTVAVDATAPSWSEGYPRVAGNSANAVDLSLAADESGVAYAVVLPSGAAAPSAAQVRAGQDASGGAVTLKGSVSLLAATNASLVVAGLAQAMSYDVYVVAEDGVLNLQPAPVHLSFTTLDTTAPSWAANYPSTANPAATSVDLKVNIDENGTVYYVVLAAGAQAPSAAQVQAGEDASGAAASLAGWENVTGATEAVVAITGLLPATDYDIYVAASDSSDNLQASAAGPLSIATTAPDTTPPVWAPSYPALANLAATAVDLLVNLSESGTAYYVVVAKDASAPSAAQVRAGTDAADSAAMHGSATVQANSEAVLAITGLAELTEYDLYVAGEDNVPNLQALAAGPLSVHTPSSDATVPSWIDAPEATTVGLTSFVLEMQADESGSAYFVVLAAGAPAPSASDVKQGQAGGGAVVASGGPIALTAAVKASAGVSGLAAGTTYEVYVIAEDAIPNLQSAPAHVHVNMSDGRSTWAMDGSPDDMSRPGTITHASSVGQNKLSGDYIGAVYIANDADYLYIGVAGFTDPWDDSRAAQLHFYVSPDTSQVGTVSQDDWMSTITFSVASKRPSYIGHLWLNSFAATDGQGGVVSARALGTGYAEVGIALSSLGSPQGTIGVIVGFRPDDAKSGFSDVAPYRDSVVSDYGNSALGIDPAGSDYIPYVIR